MTDVGVIRGALSGVQELVTFLETASTNDRSAFSKRANVIFECRTCATLFRKADGFMRHVMRCDSSRGGDVESESSDRRSFLQSTTKPTTAAAKSSVTMVPLKKPQPNGVVLGPVPVAAKTTPSSPHLQQQNLSAKKPLKSTIITIATKPEPDAESNTKTSLSPRSQKRSHSATTQKPIPEKTRKTDVDNTSKVASSVSSKSPKSSDAKLQDLSENIRPSRARKTPKWLENEFVV
ncbi:hypothetical protein KIN20_036248 [Parelaphostrongylus tenuis]|uniref:Uncharacterized protein n=1 Tax=Parelaphostrongylus tenuis TaxID=148309 RepID=A0AAD5RCR0_PARTN|nr:hypothetical protein KIN20_036248 [Parelaphostrongylus tenuis]